MASSSTDEPSIEYDFVVFYAESDRDKAYRISDFLEEEENGKFKGYLDDRDGICGRSVIANLDFALKNGKAYIVLLSKDFLDSKFQIFAMQAGLHESVTNVSNQNRLMPLLLDITEDQIPTSMRSIQDISYEPSSDMFWCKLQKSVQYICRDS